MRVIAGISKRLLLKTPTGMDTRPTADRIKETLFNIIQYDIADTNFLDLYSGSGAIGIEALSRGAKSATFIENDKKAYNCINENLVTVNLADKAVVKHTDVILGLQELEKGNYIFDVIFMDPPYNNEYEKQVLQFLKTSAIMHEGTVVIIEAAIDTDFSYISELPFNIIKIKKYKTNKHLFLERR
jgi:RNA methyltransferase, RsmD family